MFFVSLLFLKTEIVCLFCSQVYLSITDKKLLSEFFEKAYAKVSASPGDTFTYESVIDLLRAMLIYQDEDNIKRVYDLCVKNVAEGKNAKYQKKSYR